MSQNIQATAALISVAPVVPVLVVQNVDDALPMAHALVKGGLRTLEVTLRTPDALDVIEKMATIEGAIVGAGTIVRAEQVQQARDAGAAFFVSPGATQQVLEAVEATNLAFLPGAVTASEVMVLQERGYQFAKFFPAEAVGGVPTLKSLAAPLPDMTFCPTGGINLAKAPDYLSLPNVHCVGGSWVVPSDAVQAKDWNRIETLAREAARLAR